MQNESGSRRLKRGALGDCFEAGGKTNGNRDTQPCRFADWRGCVRNVRSLGFISREERGNHLGQRLEVVANECGATTRPSKLGVRLLRDRWKVKADVRSPGVRVAPTWLIKRAA